MLRLDLAQLRSRGGPHAGTRTVDQLLVAFDRVGEQEFLERAGMANCPPKLNPKGDPKKYLSDKGAPWAKLANEKPKGETIAYDTLLNAWKAGKAR